MYCVPEILHKGLKNLENLSLSAICPFLSPFTQGLCNPCSSFTKETVTIFPFWKSLLWRVEQFSGDHMWWAAEFKTLPPDSPVSTSSSLPFPLRYPKPRLSLSLLCLHLTAVSALQAQTLAQTHSEAFFCQEEPEFLSYILIVWSLHLHFSLKSIWSWAAKIL